ncbi:MAG: hypothetical protein WA140_10395 [Geobacteraceae bacterium]
MDTALRRFLAWTLLACLPLFASGCGGGGGEAIVPLTTISGIAMKGPIKGALVQVYQLLSDGRTGDLLGSGISGANGGYVIQIPTSRTSGPLLVVVKGQNGATYASESQKKDVNFTSTESFRAVVDAYDASQGVTVSPLTEAAYQKLQQILTLNPALATDGRFAGAVNDANRRIAMLFGIGNILADPAGDITHQAVLLIIDQMVVDLGASANTTTVMNLINQAFTDVTKPAYQIYLQALTVAANKVAIANPTLSSTIQAVLTLAANPSAEPDWTDTTPPTAPSNLTASTFALTATTSSVVLSWSPSTDNKGVAGYEVYRDGSRIATVSTAAYTDPSLVNNATYTYFAIAFDAVGNRSIASSQLAVPVGIPVTDTTPPTAPSNLSASTFALSPTTSSVVLMWSLSTDNKAVTGYEVYRDGSKIATVALPGYTDPLLINSTTYTYSIIAFDGAGNRSVASSQLPVTPNQPSLGVTVNGQLSSDILGLPGMDTTPPTAPSNLSASTFALTSTTSSVVLSWSPSTDNKAVTGYEIYRNGSKIATVSLPGYTDPSVGSNATYNYFIMAFDAAGNRSIASNQLLVTPNQASLGVTVNGQLSSDITGLPQLDIVAPTAPSNLAASTSATSATTSSVLLAWSASTDNKAVTGYEVYRNGIKIVTVSLLGYTDPTVTSNVTNTYYVKAFDAAGNRSPASSQLPVTPPPASLGVTFSGQLSSTIIGF